MDNLKNIVGGGIITLIVGGAAFTFNQQDVIDNFANETGISQKQAEEYVNNISEDELVTWVEIADQLTLSSEDTTQVNNEINCVSYEYEWETTTLTCSLAKEQLRQIADTELALSRAYRELESEDASEVEINSVISLLDRLNSDYKLEAAITLFDTAMLAEIEMTNIYNKSVLKAALESESQ